MSLRRTYEPIQALLNTGWIIVTIRKDGYNTPTEYRVRRVDIEAVYAELYDTGEDYEL